MTLPFALGTIPLPDWVPGWLPVALLIPIVVWLLLLLAMPFAVLGTRSRLEGIEAQLDDLHAELRSLAMQLGSSVGAPLPPRREAQAPEPLVRPEGWRPEGGRSEPRINWPRGADD